MAYMTAHEEFAALTATSSHNISHPEDAGNLSDASIPSSSFSRASSPHSIDPSPTMPSAVYRIPNTHFEGNTGPKGVIADAQSFDRARKRTLRETIFGLSASVNSNIIGVSEKISGTVRRSSRTRGSVSGSSSEGSDQEDDFMRSWREKRVLELKEGAQVRNRRLSPSKRRWGHLTPVDAVGYLDAVEKVASDVMVVVMIADDESLLSSMVDNALSNLARKHVFTRFVTLSYLEAEMDPVGAPAILAYQGGELVANLVSVVDDIPDGRDLSVSSLESVLKRHNILF